MLYRPFGSTGRDISVISFGGMRFPHPEDLDTSAELLLHAHRRGINYFDTAPVYCDDRSEEIFGHALSRLPRGDFLVSSKCSRSSGDELRASLERSLTRLQLERIDFFYIWCLMNQEDWQERQRGGAVAAALQAREEGLIGELLCSSHMAGEELSGVLQEGIFAGVLLGYNALNFPYRRKAVAEAGKRGLGVVTMNPLGGGLIPRNANRFAALRQAGNGDVVTGALHFNLSQPAITSALVGFADTAEIDTAVAAADSFTSLAADQQNQLEQQIEAAFDGLCTGCGYCLPCPVEIPVPKFMDSYNQKILSRDPDSAVAGRFRWHWGLKPEQAAACTRCCLCEERCTQHLPIIERLAELADKQPG